MIKLINDDCLKALQELPENSVDTCITDPPYGLGFMGKEWDTFDKSQFGIAGNEGDNDLKVKKNFKILPRYNNEGLYDFTFEWAQAVYRVLKPGGLLLSFGGTRTYHRIVCAIEDAGFEIRDCVMWVYGSGFPKSHDISKGIDKRFGKEREIIGRGESKGMQGCSLRNYEQGARPYINGIPNQDGYNLTAPATPEAQLWDGWGTQLKPAWEYVCVAQKPCSLLAERDIIVTRLNKLEDSLWQLLPANIVEKNFMSNRADSSGVEFDSAQWDARWHLIMGDLLDQMDMSQLESAAITSLNIVSSWKNILVEGLNDMNTFTTEMEISLITDLKILNSLLSELTPKSMLLDVIGQHGNWLHVSTVACLFHAVKMKLNYTPTLSAQGNVISKDALRNLRPNYEPIVIAQKPLDGTYAENALKWGVAGYWIDGGRIETDWNDRPESWKQSGFNKNQNKSMFGIGGTGININKGRFPSNVIHDGSDEVMRLFPSSVSRQNMVSDNRTNIGNSMFLDGVHTPENSYTDYGSAARFFYCAKASRSERNAGLEGMEEHLFGQSGGAQQALKNGESEYLQDSIGLNKIKKMQNHHPTVKPLELMRYLVRLTKTPEGGVVLDPFMGSGTTGCACVLEGRDFIGIEKEPEYIEIAQKRIEYYQTPLDKFIDDK